MRFKTLGRLVVILAAMALLLPSGLLAQTSVTGDIAGTVTDPSNAVVANATVTLTSNDTGNAQSTKSNASGSYRFTLLTPGSYRVKVAQSGFRTTEASVTIAVGLVATINLQLQVGQGSEVVEVSGAAPLIQTEDANISTNFSSKQIDLLPNGGNDLTAVANTAPGIQINTSSGGGYGNFTAFGLPATANLFTVNGNDENDPYLNLNNSGATNLLLGKNEVEETAVVSNGYTGQYGRQAGAQVDYATKSGTNTFHGNAQYFFNSGGLNANDWFLKQSGTSLPQENNNQWAASFGGPIIKDKLFFFADYEGLRYILGTSQLAIVPTPAFAAAVESNVANASAEVFGTPLTNSAPFYTQLFNAYDSNTAGLARALPISNIDASGNLGCGDLNTDAFNFAGGGITGPANVIPGYGAFGGTGPNPEYGGGNNGGGTPCAEYFRSNAGQLSHEYIVAGKVDWIRSDNDKLNFRFRADRGLQATYTDPINPIFNAVSGQPQDEGQMNWTHTFSPTVLNSFIASGLYYSAFFRSANQATATSTFPYAYIDEDTSAWTILGGENYAFPQGRNVGQYQFVDDLSITRGNHELKVGFNFRRNNITDGIFGARAVTPEALSFSESFLASGYIYEFAQRFPTRLEQPIAIWSLGTYFQDQYRVNSKLKLTMTVRFDRNSNAVCQTNCFSTLAAPFNELTKNAATPYNQEILNNQHTAFPNIEKVVVQPRFGFAWTPKGQNTVFRGGIGLFSDLYPGTIVDNFARNSPSVNSFALLVLPFSPAEAGSAESTITGANTAFNTNFANGGNAATFLASAPPFSSVPVYNSIASTVKNPKYVEWNFEVQQAFGPKTSVNLNYVGNRGYDEFVTNWAGNSWYCIPATPPATGCTSATFGSLPNAVPDPHFRYVSQLNNPGTSNYNGLTASATRRFTAGFTGTFNFTWSHALDEVSNGGIDPYSINDSFLNQINPNCLRCLNYSNADYDVRKAVSANYVWELPFKSANSMLNRVASGWVLSGTFFFHTGYPYTVNDAAAPTATPGLHNGNDLTILPDFLGGATNPGCSNPGPASSPTQCLTSSQFTSVTGETNFGNVPRNSFRGAGYFNSDFSVLKNIPLTERVSFGLGATAYNVFNHPNFSNPVGDISSGQFGQITSTVVPPTSPYGSFVGSAVSGRLLQVNARLTF